MKSCAPTYTATGRGCPAWGSPASSIAFNMRRSGCVMVPPGRWAPTRRFHQLFIWVVASNAFYFHPYLGKWSNFDDHIFQMGWNHQPVMFRNFFRIVGVKGGSLGYLSRAGQNYWNMCKDWRHQQLQPIRKQGCRFVPYRNMFGNNPPQMVPSRI